jgi:hypothetical protein
MIISDKSIFSNKNRDIGPYRVIPSDKRILYLHADYSDLFHHSKEVLKSLIFKNTPQITILPIFKEDIFLKQLQNDSRASNMALGSSSIWTKAYKTLAPFYIAEKTRKIKYN